MEIGSFLRGDENKSAFFVFLEKHIAALVLGGKLISSLNDDVFSAATTDCEGPALSSHQEEETRTLQHAAHASRKGHNRIMTGTVD